jgi:hypothetical protein
VFGWTLDYVDSLPYDEMLIYFGIRDADEKLKPKQ